VDILNRLDVATQELIEQLRQLKAENKTLRDEKQEWQKDRSHLLGEIDRILNRLDAVKLEES